MADDEHRPEQLGLAQNGLRLRNHVRGRELIPSMRCTLGSCFGTVHRDHECLEKRKTDAGHG
jgi:hypothetical protein